MPIVAAPLFGFSLGIVFAWAGCDELARLGSGITSRSLVVTALFGVLVYAPTCGYFQAFFPDWSYAYLLDAERRPVVLDLATLLVDALSPAVGLVLFSRAAAARRSATLARAAAVPALVAALFILSMLSRLRVFGTYAQFHGDFGTEPLTGSPIGYALVWMTAIVTGATAFTIHVLRRLGEPGSRQDPI